MSIVIPQRSSADCEESALATASGESYEAAKKAIGKAQMLPEGANDPLFGNPENMRAAIERLGYKPIRRTYGDIVNRIAIPGKTMVLLHLPEAPTLRQHWVVLESVGAGHVAFHWGDGTVKGFRFEQFLKLFTGGFPNAALEVGPFQGKIGRFQQVLNWFKNLFRGR